MTKNGLKIPLITVQMKDGSEWPAQAYQGEMVAWETHAFKNKLDPTGQSMLWTWTGFLAWKASIRDGAIPARTTLPDFMQDLAQALPETPEDADADVDVDVDPTPPAPAIGSA